MEDLSRTAVRHRFMVPVGRGIGGAGFASCRSSSGVGKRNGISVTGFGGAYTLWMNTAAEPLDSEQRPMQHTTTPPG